MRLIFARDCRRLWWCFGIRVSVCLPGDPSSFFIIGLFSVLEGIRVEKSRGRASGPPFWPLPPLPLSLHCATFAVAFFFSLVSHTLALSLRLRRSRHSLSAVPPLLPPSFVLCPRLYCFVALLFCPLFILCPLFSVSLPSMMLSLSVTRAAALPPSPLLLPLLLLPSRLLSCACSPSPRFQAPVRTRAHS